MSNLLALAGSTRRHAAAGSPGTSFAVPAYQTMASTPNQSAFNTTDVDARVSLTPTTWPPSANGAVCGHTNNTSRRWALFLLSTGKPSMAISTTGSGYVYKGGDTAYTSSTGSMVYMRGTIDANNGASGYDVKFYTRSDASIHLNTGWTQLGSTVTVAGAFTFATTAATMQIGGDESLDQNVYGNYTRMVYMDGIAGSVVADFDATQVTVTGSQLPATYTDAYSNVWTPSGTGWAWNT